MTYWTKPVETRAEAVARIHAMKGWPDSCRGHDAQRQPAVESDRQAFADRLRARFDPPTDPYSMAQRLGFRVGDPDAESGDWGQS